MTKIIPDINVVIFAFIASWAMCCAGLALYYQKGGWRKAMSLQNGVEQA